MPLVLLALALFVMILTGLVITADDGRGGYHAFRDGEYTAALTELTPHAQAGDAEAQTLLGQIYGDGLVGTIDEVEASKWFTLAAKQGDVDAQYRLAMILFEKQSSNNQSDQALRKEALAWLRAAADQGVAQAQNLMGDLRRKGEDIQQDMVLARRWYEASAAQNYAGAQFNMGLIEYRKGETEMAEVAGLASIMRRSALYRAKEGYQEAESWFFLAAEQGHAEAQYYLGHIYFYGQGVTRDFAVASNWYQKAAKQEWAAALYALSEMAATGRGLRKSPIKATGYIRRAAYAGHPAAQYELAQLFANSKEYLRAYMWFDLAARHPDQDGIEERDIMGDRLSPTQVAKAQTMAEECLVSNYKGC